VRRGQDQDRGQAAEAEALLPAARHLITDADRVVLSQPDAGLFPAVGAGV
jgi:hypothetical protein